MKNIYLFLLALALTGEAGAQALKPSVASEPYVWKSVQIVGGGFVDGIVFHPNAKDVRYCRTDMGGAYRWDSLAKRWVSMLDWISYDDNNLVGVESIAVDPNDSLTVYVACGTYTQSQSPVGAIMCSHDGGRSFTRVDVPFKMGGNENGRGNGERMMVDPANSKIIYMGTRNDGLWRSTDAGQSWQKVSSFPDVTEKIPEIPDNSQGISSVPNGQSTGQANALQSHPMFSTISWGCGVVCVVYDLRTAIARQGCSTIYVAVSLMNRDNLFVSKDCGVTWKAVTGQPTKYRPTHMVMADDSNLFLTYGDNPGPMRMSNGAVWKYNTVNGKWLDISPVKANPDKGLKFGYAAVSVDKQNPKHLIVSTFNRPVEGVFSEDEIFRTIDGGKSWYPVFANGTERDYSKAPYVKFTPLHWMFDIEIDPYDANHAMFTTGYGGWETFNLDNIDKKNPTYWSIMSAGVEETVPLELYSPKDGAQLITAIGDYGGFTHFDLDTPNEGHTNPYYANENGVTGAENNPAIVVRVGIVSAHHPQGKPLAYSLDGGVTWNEPSSLPAEAVKGGHIAVSSDGEIWIWTPERSAAYYTTDRGASWKSCGGIARNIRVVADRVNPKRFYGIDATLFLLYESNDGGATFTSKELRIKAQNADLFQMMMNRGNQNRSELRGDNRGGQDRIYTTPGIENDCWIAAYDGLYHALSGCDFMPMDKVRRIYGFGFGKAKPGNTYPSIYLAGIVNGISGFFRSDDRARTWVRINDDDHQLGMVLQISGDPKIYGRVYVGAHGRGVTYGDLVSQ